MNKCIANQLNPTGALGVFLFLVILFTGLPEKLGAGVPGNNLSYPVLIQADSRTTGSGFFLEARRSIYLITARHVLAREEAPGVITVFAQTSSPDSPAQMKLSLDLDILRQSNRVYVHATKDVVAVQIGTMEGPGDLAPLQYHEGVEVIQKGTLTVVAEANTLSFHDIGVSNQVFVMGYPVSVGIENAKQIDHRTPLVRAGIVAGKNHIDGSVILDCQVDGGNSGGPVLQVSEDTRGNRKYRVIGLVSEFVPSAEEWVSQTRGQVSVNISNSGYAVVEPMDSIWELIQFPQLYLTQDSR